jgi:hypothetical protein
MKIIKNLLRAIRRHVKSYIGFIMLFKQNKNKNIDEYFLANFDQIHIVCPGPTSEKFLEYKVDEKSAVIFVNHAVKLSGYFADVKNKFYYSSDPIRTMEVIEQSNSELKACKSFLVPAHLYQVEDKSILENIDLVFLPKIDVSRKYGLIGAYSGPDNFSEIENRPTIAGYGSLVNALKFSIRFSPSKITLWGCDFGDKNGVRYSNKISCSTMYTPFDLIRDHFNIVKTKLEDMNVLIKNGSDDH